MKQVYPFVLFVVLLFACTAPKKITSSQETQPANIAGNGKLFASVFIQRAAEYHALCLQAYNIARRRIDEIAQQPFSKSRAIVTDLDETVLDNSANEVHQD